MIKQNISCNGVVRGPSRTITWPSWVKTPFPRPAARPVPPEFLRLQSIIAKATTAAPPGPAGASLARVLDDLLDIARQYSVDVDQHVAGLERCVSDYVRNAKQLAKGEIGCPDVPDGVLIPCQGV